MAKKTSRSRASKAIVQVKGRSIQTRSSTPRRIRADSKGGIGRVTQPVDPRRALFMIPMPQVIAGIRLTDQEAMQLSVVWACIDAIVKAVVCSDWQVFEVRHRQRRIERIFLAEDPIYWLLNKRPNPEATAIGWREAMYYSAVGTGNGYSEITRNGAGKVTGLYWLESNRVVPRREILPDGTYGEVVYDVWQYGGGWITLRQEDIFHLRGPSLDSLVGDHMLARAAHAIANAVAAERFRGNYFANNTVMGTILKHPRTLSDTAHKRLIQDYEEKHKGPHKAHKPLILEGGMDIVTNVGNDPQKSQMIESSQLAVEEICRFFGVPPHKVQHLLRSTYNNIEHLGIEFTRDAVTPWAKRGEQEADYKLFPQKAPWRETRHDTAWLQYGDAKTQAEAFQIYRRTGVYSVNDILAKKGENTIGPEGDTRMVELAMQPLTALEDVGRKASAEADKAERDAAEPAPDPAGPGGKKSGGGGDNEEKTTEPPPSEPLGAAPAKPFSPRQALRDATVALVAGALDRYGRRLANREANLRRGGKHDDLEVSVHMAQERSELRPRLVEECVEALAIAAKAQPDLQFGDAEHEVVNAADFVDNSGDARSAAEAFVNRYLRSEA